MSDYKKDIIKLIESDITGYKIFKATGISQSKISSLRNGKQKIDDLTLRTTEKLYKYYNEQVK